MLHTPCTHVLYGGFLSKATVQYEKKMASAYFLLLYTKPKYYLLILIIPLLCTKYLHSVIGNHILAFVLESS